MRHNTGALMLFLLGLFSDTQIRIVGYMDISEFMCYVLGPYYLCVDLGDLRRDGFGKFIFVWILCCASCMISAWVNESVPAQWMRGLAAPISMLCLTSTIYHFLRKDFYAFKWFFLGVAFSGILSTFMFQRGAAIETREGTLSGAEATENVMNYSLYWLQRLSTWVLLPVYMFYLKIPKWYSIAAGITIMMFGFFSAGNRSGLIVAAAAVMIIVIGGKSVVKMRLINKHFVMIGGLMILIVPTFLVFYKYCAVHNLLGEAAYKKYMAQTKSGGGAMQLIRAGRAEFFIGLDACLDRPIIGQGPHALDVRGYRRSYLAKYADVEDYNRITGYFDKLGIVPIIPAHSWVISFWMWYGVGGLICMIYVGWLMFGTLKNRLAVIPELYGYWAYALLPSVWHYFFSPFGGRTGVAMMLVLCLMTRAIEKRRKAGLHFASISFNG